MNRSRWILALLALVGGYAFYVLSHNSSSQQLHERQRQADSLNGSQPSLPAVSISSPRRDAQPEVPRLTEQEGLKKTTEGWAKVAAIMTPEHQKMVNDSVMKVWKPRYLALFETWGLNDKTSAYVLDVIRNREARLQAIRADSYSQPHSAENMALSKKLRESEEKLAELELVATIGKEHFQELVVLQKELNTPKPR